MKMSPCVGRDGKGCNIIYDYLKKQKRKGGGWGKNKSWSWCAIGAWLDYGSFPPSDHEEFIDRVRSSFSVPYLVPFLLPSLSSLDTKTFHRFT
jgi:hypothetical protein